MDTSTAREESRTWFTVFLQEFSMIEEFVNQMESGPIRSSAFELDPEIETSIAQLLSSHSKTP